MWIRNEKIISRIVDDEAVLIDPSLGFFYVLNGTAAWLWELLASPVSLERLTTVFSSSDDTLDASITEIRLFLDQLTQLSLLTETDSAEAPLESAPIPMPWVSPSIQYQDSLQSAAGICGSGHSGGVSCKSAIPCVQLFS